MSVCPLEPFKPNSGVDFEEWEERLSMYFVSQGITEELKQRATLLTYLSPEGYTLVKNLLHPSKPTEETLENIVKKLKEHLLPPTNPITERFKFYSRYRHEGERISDFVADLRQIARNCEFKDLLEENLRDRIVCGVNNEAIQKKLLAHGRDLTYKKAIDSALAMELASVQSAGLKSSTMHRREVEVNKIDDKVGHGNAATANASGRMCFRCGSKFHLANTCKFKESECYTCHRKGHVSRVCRSTDAKLLDSEKPDEAGELYNIFECSLSHQDSFVAVVKVDGKSVRIRERVCR